MGIPYCGMRGPPDLVGQYYAAEGLRIATGGRVVPYFRKDGGVQPREVITGRFISPEDALDFLVKRQPRERQPERGLALLLFLN